jgi:hypothetical protein
MTKEAIIKLLERLPEGTQITELGTNITEGVKLHLYPSYIKPITWSADDFEAQAKNVAEDYWDEVFDPEKFENALEVMIQHHDTYLGITWDTVDYYLREYCRRPEREEEDDKD